MNKSELLCKVRHTPMLAKIDDIVGLSKWAKSRNDRALTRQLAQRYYRPENGSKACNGKPEVVTMFDGRVNQGGLCDRLWGVVSTYLYCKDNDLQFKLNFTTPFDITDYLQPAANVDWRISPSELTYDSRTAQPLVIKCLGYGREDNLSPIKRLIAKGTKQVHIYTNAHSYRSRFHEGFTDLFKPSDVVARTIDDVISREGDGYVSISFRFVRLFGDFDDVAWPVLPDERSREDMIKRGLGAIERIKALHPGKKVLVTTDSPTFLARAREVEDVFVVEGEIKHVDFSDTKGVELPHLKTFLDLLLLARSKHVYLGMNEQVYPSTFSRTAAIIGDHPFDTIQF